MATKYKNPPIWAKFGFQVDYDVGKFFVSMATAAKFVQPIPIFLAYHVPLVVDVVPIKFHQFLFSE
jgi:hypothetical protein